eukprot:CAMPEP_0197179650 /NCGR_PEP_ID=MMETSP1423-20130617/4520_1 /TAXON_ID=476441 /ORGANISM="Pseudo-nitzschia heimii, Strain UNC1101" /LENGTH=385 /DNA_ID=CAMNT_0042629579 /DNA_START=139 /DNA_END=1293 /DNA_ORIENTATION=+
MAGSTKTKRTFNNENNVSGYSADREGPSTHPPVVSTNLHSIYKSSTGVNALKCPKRQKKNEIQFAAATVKADLARAGKGFETFQKHSQKSSIFANENINLKGHVTLLFSKDISKSLVPPSNIGRQTTIVDYTSLISAVRGFYPHKPTQISDLKSFEQILPSPSGQNAWSEPSISSVSDTLSDYGSYNTNNQVSGLAPLLEDSLDPRTKNRRKNKRKNDTVELIDSTFQSSSEITMASILQLTKTARIVTNSFAPYSIVHANAAFHRLSGKNANDTVIGKSFFSLLDPEANPSQDKMSLSSFMISTRKGNDPKLYLTSDSAVSEKRIDPVKCTIRVSPVSRQKAEIEDHNQVGYFVIEFVPDGKEFDETSLAKGCPVSFSKSNTPM